MNELRITKLIAERDLLDYQIAEHQRARQQAVVAEVLLQQAAKLITAAKGLGFILTIDLVPNKPLAMGNYDMVARVRPINVREPS